ncbi:MAG: PilZ domain-containing protein [Desulfovibrionaceae bacterium]|nr:PilZ domain-containing protein [Desulfovibrionaceae bacterium]
MIDSEDVILEQDEDQKQHRRAFRVEPPGSITLTISDRVGRYAIKDISFLGVAFIYENYRDFAIGQKIKINVLLREYIFLQDLVAEVVRVIEKEKCVACTFPELSASDEMRLTKLVLEIQKEYIRRTTKVL